MWEVVLTCCSVRETGVLTGGGPGRGDVILTLAKVAAAFVASLCRMVWDTGIAILASSLFL